MEMKIDPIFIVLENLYIRSHYLENLAIMKVLKFKQWILIKMKLCKRKQPLCKKKGKTAYDKWLSPNPRKAESFVHRGLSF